MGRRVLHRILEPADLQARHVPKPHLQDRLERGEGVDKLEVERKHPRVGVFKEDGLLAFHLGRQARLHLFEPDHRLLEHLHVGFENVLHNRRTLRQMAQFCRDFDEEASLRGKQLVVLLDERLGRITVVPDGPRELRALIDRLALYFRG